LRARFVTDGGQNEWGATLWLPGAKEPLKANGPYRTEDVAAGRCAQQAWREGYATNLGVLAFQTQIAGGAVLHLSDCACVVKAIEDGSVKSEMLQDQAIEIWELTTKLGMLLNVDCFYYCS